MKFTILCPNSPAGFCPLYIAVCRGVAQQKCVPCGGCRSKDNTKALQSMRLPKTRAVKGSDPKSESSKGAYRVMLRSHNMTHLSKSYHAVGRSVEQKGDFIEDKRNVVLSVSPCLILGVLERQPVSGNQCHHIGKEEL